MKNFEPVNIAWSIGRGKETEHRMVLRNSFGAGWEVPNDAQLDYIAASAGLFHDIRTMADYERECLHIRMQISTMAKRAEDAIFEAMTRHEEMLARIVDARK